MNVPRFLQLSLLLHGLVVPPACGSEASRGAPDTGWLELDAAAGQTADSRPTPEHVPPPDGGPRNANCLSECDAQTAPDLLPGHGPDEPAPQPDAGSPQPLVLYALRHAENEIEHLSEAGRTRAAALARQLQDVPLAAVFASSRPFSQETVAPTAEAQGLRIDSSCDSGAELARRILHEHSHRTVLACGHTYTLPELFQTLGCTTAPTVIDQTVFGQLWILTRENAGCTVLETRYGD